jgi:4-hydroxy-tetrahydrodipicolinate synthase
MTDSRLSPGVWAVVATPFHRADMAVDRDSLTRLVRHYDGCGVTGLTLLGVFGEAAGLSTAERRAVLETARDAVDLPVIAGITALSTAPAEEEIGLIQEVLDTRLVAVMVQVNSSRPEVLSAHLNELHRNTGAALVVQDYPIASGVTIPTADLITALASATGAVAVKAETPPTSIAIHAITSALGLPAFGGLGGIGLLDELAAGAAGVMTGFSYPEALVATTNAWTANGYEAAREAFLRYLPLVNFEQQGRVALAIRKRCLYHRGLIAADTVRPPALTMPHFMEDQLVRHIDAIEKVTVR